MPYSRPPARIEIRPPNPPTLGGTGVQSLPELGDLGGFQDSCRRSSEFTLARVKKQFDLTTSEDTDIFAAVPKLESSKYLAETLRYNVPLALASNSEKSSI